MTGKTSDDRRRKGPWAGGALALLSVVAVAVWWVGRAADEERLDTRLAAWSDAPLPAPGDPVDGALADVGADIFRSRCSACHQVRGEPKLGPNLAGVTARRSYRWIEHMILRPDSMTLDDPVAAALRAQYGVQMMVPGGMTPVRARAVLEFLRRADEEEG
jgi:mono/diheme cytochrome c family protein